MQLYKNPLKYIRKIQSIVLSAYKVIKIERPLLH